MQLGDPYAPCGFKGMMFTQQGSTILNTKVAPHYGCMLIEALIEYIDAQDTGVSNLRKLE